MAPRVPLPIQPGLVHTPSTHEAAVVLEELLYKDYVSHHIFFNDLGFHDHLSHHLVSAYDTGAPPALLKLIYKDVSQIMRPLDRQEADIIKSNWTARLGERKAYSSYLAFFSDEMSKKGMEETFRKYVMAPEANGNGAAMLARFFEGASVHSMLTFAESIHSSTQEFVLPRLALGAVTESEMTEFVLDQPSNLAEIKETKGVTLFALLREVYDSDILKPILSDNLNAPEKDRIRKFTQHPERGAELRRIYAKWSIDTTLTGAASDTEFDAKVEGCPCRRRSSSPPRDDRTRPPRMEFFLLHVVTSALCLPSVRKILPDPEQKAQFLQAYARSAALWVLVRGRPRIDIPLLISYTDPPSPPANWSPGSADALGGATNPWLAIVQNALDHKDTHVLKTVRALYYCAQRYGLTAPGEEIGARVKMGHETHVGAGKMDGSIFVRAAGVVSETLGWVAYEQTIRTQNLPVLDGSYVGGRLVSLGTTVSDSPTALVWDAAWDD
ncbi:hypothetical protein B0H11DRAFT_1741354 [Mycena galericulata]|nr:hypothetical protein B0H11DRAFT_1741354 [Mycena galericulata]